MKRALIIEAIEELQRRKLRTGLTLLGMILVLPQLLQCYRLAKITDCP